MRRYVPLLPQHLEQRDLSAHAIRDEDLRALLSCDLGLFHYDGPELDSGTVVEFMTAKFADIPAVLLRTDFRRGGDQQAGGEPWNLMSSFYPRTRSVVLDAMALYQDAPPASARRSQATRCRPPWNHRLGTAAARGMTEAVADAVIAALDEVCALAARAAGVMPGGRFTNGWRSCPEFRAAHQEAFAADLRRYPRTPRKRRACSDMKAKCALFLLGAVSQQTGYFVARFCTRRAPPALKPSPAAGLLDLQLAQRRFQGHGLPGMERRGPRVLLRLENGDRRSPIGRIGVSYGSSRLGVRMGLTCGPIA